MHQINYRVGAVGEKSIEKGLKPYPYTDIIRIWSLGRGPFFCYGKAKTGQRCLFGESLQRSLSQE